MTRKQQGELAILIGSTVGNLAQELFSLILRPWNRLTGTSPRL